MKSYSMDLRQRVIEAYENGLGTQEELAERFDVSLTFVERLLRRWRETGSIAPKPNGGGRRAKVTGTTLKRLTAAIEESPDATLEELRGKCGAEGSIMCIFRALKRLRITLKKSRSSIQNNSIQRSRRKGRSGEGV